MRNDAAIQEEFMNGSRMIPPRVGGGVGVRWKWGVEVSIQDQSMDLTVSVPLWSWLEKRLTKNRPCQHRMSEGARACDGDLISWGCVKCGEWQRA